LDAALFSPPATVGDRRARPGGSGRKRAWIFAAIAGVVVAAIALGSRVLPIRPPEGRTPMRFGMQLPRGYRFSGYANSAVSPDGRNVVYAAGDSSGTARLHVRRFDSIEARVLT